MEFSLVMDHDFSKVTVTESRDTAAMHEESAVQNQCVFDPSSLYPCPSLDICRREGLGNLNT
jgi:hypothetical protein